MSEAGRKLECGCIVCETFTLPCANHPERGFGKVAAMSTPDADPTRRAEYPGDYERDRAADANKRDGHHVATGTPRPLSDSFRSSHESAGAPVGTDWLVWSNEHRAWWRANSSGYTTSIEAAGRYTQAEAHEIVRHACPRAQSSLRDGEPPEIAVALADALARCTCFGDAARPEPGRFHSTDCPLFDDAALCGCQRCAVDGKPAQPVHRARTPSAPVAPERRALERAIEQLQKLNDVLSRTRNLSEHERMAACNATAHALDILRAQVRHAAPVAPAGKIRSLTPSERDAVEEYYDEVSTVVAPAGRQPCDIVQQDTSAELAAREGDGSGVLDWLREFRESFEGNIWHEHVYDAAIAEINRLRAGRQDTAAAFVDLVRDKWRYPDTAAGERAAAEAQDAAPAGALSGDEHATSAYVYANDLRSMAASIRGELADGIAPEDAENLDAIANWLDASRDAVAGQQDEDAEVLIDELLEAAREARIRIARALLRSVVPPSDICTICGKPATEAFFNPWVFACGEHHDEALALGSVAPAAEPRALDEAWKTQAKYWRSQAVLWRELQKLRASQPVAVAPASQMRSLTPDERDAVEDYYDEASTVVAPAGRQDTP